MIVKNETRVIRRLLDSVAPYIDTYCICDTGSTDGTADVIRAYFEARHIPGQVYSEPFRDFGYNRTHALRAAEVHGVSGSEYVLLLDADMVWTSTLTPEAFKAKLARSPKDAYYVYQGSPALKYKNVRLLKLGRGFTYWGVTHEYVDAPADAVFELLDDQEAFIDDVGDGGSKGDKAERDIRLLEEGLKQLPDNVRYLFYLANTYSDCGRYDDAIRTYKRRIAQGGWVEELWYSHYKIGKCFAALGDHASAIFHWIEALQVFPDRIENLYEVVHYYRVVGNHRAAIAMYQVADSIRRTHPPHDFLFLQLPVYTTLLDYEWSILGYYHHPDPTNMFDVCMKLLASPALDDALYRNVLSNYKFYAPMPEVTETIVGLGICERVKVGSEWLVGSTPSVAYDGDLRQWVVCTRYVNYRIDDQGNYVNQAHIVSHNVVSVYDSGATGPGKKLQEFVLAYDTSKDGHYVGLEDVRPLYVDKRWYYVANRAVEGGRMAVEFGVLDLEGQTCRESRFLTVEGQKDTEKNWVLFDRNGEGLGCVYSWGPLRVGHIEGDRVVITSTDTSVPRFFQDVRGSSNGQIDLSSNEIWFLCHLVSYEDRRYYYHLWVVLDATTYRYKRHSPLWTFTGAKVEYALGFVPCRPDGAIQHLVVGFSTMDTTTHVVQMARPSFCDAI